MTVSYSFLAFHTLTLFNVPQFAFICCFLMIKVVEFVGRISEWCTLLITAYQRGIHGISMSVTGYINLDYLSSARCLQCKVTIFPLPYSVHLKGVTKSSLLSREEKLTPPLGGRNIKALNSKLSNSKKTGPWSVIYLLIVQPYHTCKIVSKLITHTLW